MLQGGHSYFISIFCSIQHSIVHDMEFIRFIHPPQSQSNITQIHRRRRHQRHVSGRPLFGWLGPNRAGLLAGRTAAVSVLSNAARLSGAHRTRLAVVRAQVQRTLRPCAGRRQQRVFAGVYAIPRLRLATAAACRRCVRVQRTSAVDRARSCAVVPVWHVRGQFGARTRRVAAAGANVFAVGVAGETRERICESVVRSGCGGGHVAGAAGAAEYSVSAGVVLDCIPMMKFIANICRSRLQFLARNVRPLRCWHSSAWTAAGFAAGQPESLQLSGGSHSAFGKGERSICTFVRVCELVGFPDRCINRWIVGVLCLFSFMCVRVCVCGGVFGDVGGMVQRLSALKSHVTGRVIGGSGGGGVAGGSGSSTTASDSQTKSVSYVDILDNK